MKARDRAFAYFLGSSPWCHRCTPPLHLPPAYWRALTNGATTDGRMTFLAYFSTTAAVRTGWWGVDKRWRFIHCCLCMNMPSLVVFRGSVSGGQHGAASVFATAAARGWRARCRRLGSCVRIILPGISPGHAAHAARISDLRVYRQLPLVRRAVAHLFLVSPLPARNLRSISRVDNERSATRLRRRRIAAAGLRCHTPAGWTSRADPSIYASTTTALDASHRGWLCCAVC